MNNKKLLLLLTPSWLVNVIGITAGVLLTASVIVLANFEGSQLRQQLFDVQNAAPASSSSSLADNYDLITTRLADNSFLGMLPLLLTWAGIGFIVYLFAARIIKSLGEVIELHDQMEYVNASRQSLIRQAIIQLTIRIAAVLGWFIFIKITTDVIIPYAIAASYAAAQEVSIASAGSALLSVVIIYITTCVHAVFLRLIVLKPRLFGERF